MDTLNTTTRRRAAAMVEMALILPVLIVLTFGLMEYGWVFLKAAQVNNAARQGARSAVRPDATDAEVRAAVAQVMTEAGMTNSGYQVQITSLTAPKGDPVTVVVTVTYDNVSLGLGGLVPVPTQLTGRVSMAKEGP